MADMTIDCNLELKAIKNLELFTEVVNAFTTFPPYHVYLITLITDHAHLVAF
jgi:hypothetical protein